MGPAVLERTVFALVNLAAIDPGGHLANRPLNSLREIFLPWLPSTNAPLSMRIRVLDAVLERAPDVGWKLLVALLPSLHDSSITTLKPRWRDAGASEKERLTRRMVLDTYAAVTERALARADDHPDRWQKLISAMLAFDRSTLEKVREGLRALSERIQSADARFTVWSKLRDEINRHRRFASADWALSEEELQKFDVIIARLAPTDIVQQSVWLFDQYHPDLPHAYDRADIHAADEPRKEALEAIISRGGVDDVIRLAKHAKIPGLVGVAAVAATPGLEPLQELIEHAISVEHPLEQFIEAVSSEALHRFGEPWRQWVLDGIARRGWRGDQAVIATSRWPDTEATWTSVADLGPEVEEAYWRRKPMLRIQDSAARDAAIRKYIDVGRAAEALHAYAYRAEQLPSPLLLELLDRTLQKLNTRTALVSGDLGYDVGEVLDVLVERNDVDRIEIARREYAFLTLIDYNQRRLVLHDLLVAEPALFVQVISDVYRPASQEAQREVTEEQARRATMGYRVLQSLRRIPGAVDDGSLNSDAMRTWLASVRELARQADRSIVTDHQIGRLLAYAPHDPTDGSWPHRVVRDLLEELHSHEIEREMITEQLNKRGVYTKAPFEGGAQERGLAERARGWARDCRPWPRTALLLEGIAEMWDGYARHEDEDAEKHKARFG